MEARSPSVYDGLLVILGKPDKEGGQPIKGKSFPYMGAGLALAPKIKQKKKDVPQAYLQYIEVATFDCRVYEGQFYINC